MAQSRLEKIGTIFTRVQGLLRGGAIKAEDKPIWYDVYAAFPPNLEPRFDRSAPNIPVRNIFYAEDIIRAKFHKHNKPNESISLFDLKRASQSQQFLQIYKNLKFEGALDERRIYETALDLLAEQRTSSQTAIDDDTTIPVNEPEVASKSKLLSDFQAAGEQRQHTIPLDTIRKTKKENITDINIDSLFKD